MCVCVCEREREFVFVRVFVRVRVPGCSLIFQWDAFALFSEGRRVYKALSMGVSSVTSVLHSVIGRNRSIQYEGFCKF